MSHVKWFTNVCGSQFTDNMHHYLMPRKKLYMYWERIVHINVLCHFPTYFPNAVPVCVFDHPLLPDSVSKFYTN